MIVSTYWNGNRGAVTWGSGITGISGTVSEANSLVGSNPDDRVGWANILTRGVIPLSNGNYLVESRFWNGNRGAVTWGNGYTGVIGIVSAANSLVGSTPSGSDPGDSLDLSVATLNNGNYVVIMPYWNADRGAVTWGSGTTGVSGTISEANSLVGSDPGDQVGGGLADGYLGGVIPLSNGDYVVQSPDWNHDRGAVTWVNGSIGIGAKVSDANSLVGSNPGDYVGSDGLTFVGNGNYVIHSPLWNGYRGAATWVDGSTGLSGIVSTDNSLVGTNPRHGLAGYNSGDMVGSDIIPLSNGNYVVGSSTWNGGRGAVTWANGRTGITGTITAANSLVGNIPGDYVGQLLIIAFPNGNYLVVSTSWHYGRGAVTWGNGNTGVSGIVSAANSLVGSSPPEVGFGDQVGSGGITFLNNGNYVVSSPAWNSGHGAFTWGNGSAGVSGTVSAANSLVDGNAESKRTRIIPLSNGNYVVNMPDWNGTRGAVTWGNGTTGVSGIISDANSLVGDNPGDHVGAFNSSPLAMVSLVPWNGVIPLSNGNYVVTSPDWNGFRGAVTWGNGSTGIEGKVSDANSLVGSKVGDKVGADLITPLSNGNYVVSSSGWNGYRGAVTWGDGGKGTSGIVSDANSLVGSYPDDLVGGYGVAALSNGDYAFRCPSWNDNRGAVTWGDGSTGSSGTVSEVNSLVGANLGEWAPKLSL